MSLPIAALFLLPRVNAVVNQRRLAGSAHTRHAHKHVQRNLDVDRFEIVFGRALNRDASFVRRTSLLWLLDLRITAQVTGSQRSFVVQQTREVAFVDQGAKAK